MLSSFISATSASQPTLDTKLPTSSGITLPSSSYTNSLIEPSRINWVGSSSNPSQFPISVSGQGNIAESGGFNIAGYDPYYDPLWQYRPAESEFQDILNQLLNPQPTLPTELSPPQTPQTPQGSVLGLGDFNINYAAYNEPVQDWGAYDWTANYDLGGFDFGGYGADWGGFWI